MASADDKLPMCGGCRNDFYNGKNPLHVKRCWSLDDAKIVTRWRIGTFTLPTQRAAFTEVETLDCHHEEGSSFYKELPSFAIDPNRLARGKGGRL